jgi:hypothetical protein
VYQVASISRRYRAVKQAMCRVSTTKSQKVNPIYATRLLNSRSTGQLTHYYTYTLMSLETFLYKYANHLAIFLTIVAIGIASSIVMPLFRKSIDFRGKVCPCPLHPFLRNYRSRTMTDGSTVISLVDLLDLEKPSL